jgi:hypothetical protein
MTEIKIRNDGERGVFATQPFNKGDWVCNYPAHSICDDEKNNYYINNECYFNNNYSIELDNNIGISGDPSNEDDGFGHLINDGSNDLNNYWKDSLDKENVIPIQKLRYDKKNNKYYIPIIATKPIKKNEEIYFSYGIDYWKSNDLYNYKHKYNTRYSSKYKTKKNGNGVRLIKLLLPYKKDKLNKLVKPIRKTKRSYSV